MQIAQRHKRIGKTPQLHAHDSERNRAILEGCPSLYEAYNPVPWASNAHSQILLYLAFEARSPTLQWDKDERLVMKDGGTVSLQWWGLHGKDVTDSTPILLVLPTICGYGDDLRGFVRRIQKTLGWIVVVCNRRGHGPLPLTSPQINTMGNTDDLRAQMQVIQERRPQAPLYAVGLSAGSGLLVRYLGEEGSQTPLRAGIAFCPAYDISVSFSRVHPWYDKIMAKKLLQYFLQKHQQTLSEVPGFAQSMATRSMDEFHQKLFPLAGFQDQASYFEASNPMVVAQDCRIPTLVLNALDDPICPRKSLEEGLEGLHEHPEHYIVAVTKHGSHCAFFEGFLRLQSWAEKVMAEFLQSVSKLDISV